MFPAQNIQTTHLISFVVGGLLEEKYLISYCYQYTETNTLILICLFFFLLYKRISARDGQITAAEDGNGQVA